MEGSYPKSLYRPDGDSFESVTVMSKAEQDDLDGDWFESPADFGIETCPNGDTQDPVIAAKRTNVKAKAQKAPAAKAKPSKLDDA